MKIKQSSFICYSGKNITILAIPCFGTLPESSISFVISPVQCFYFFYDDAHLLVFYWLSQGNMFPPFIRMSHLCHSRFNCHRRKSDLLRRRFVRPFWLH